MTPVKFFCEFCGSQVRAADRICPHCGSFFSQVRCPACGFQGDSKLFVQGCPVCGFATGAANQKSPKVEAGISKKSPAKASQDGYIINENATKRTQGVPGWVYGILIGLFLGVIVLAIVVLQSTR